MKPMPIFLLAGLALGLAGGLSPAVAENAMPNSERLAAAEQRLAAIRARTQGVADVNAVENLQRIYGYYLDEMLWDQVADLFAKDGTMEVADLGVYKGSESIRKFLYAIGGGKSGPLEGRLFDHMQLQPIVHVAPDGLTAKGRWRAFIQTATFGKEGYWGDGIYENEYVKEDGVWKIKTLHWYMTFFAPYSKGWGKATASVKQAYDAGALPPPDAPPTAVYDPYKTVYVPPFHYQNPVSGTEGGAQ